MTTKSEFNADEWETVIDGPALAGLIVIARRRTGSNGAASGSIAASRRSRWPIASQVHCRQRAASPMAWSCV